MISSEEVAATVSRFPDRFIGIAVATKHPNVFIDTSTYTSKRFPPELVHYMKTNGRKKLLFGTNYPMILPGKCLQDLDALNLEEEAKTLFLHQNVKRFFAI